MVELTTRYLGLELRSPIVASASPLNRRPRRRPPARGRRRRRRRAAVAVRGGDPPRGGRAQPGARGRVRALRRGARLLPRRRRPSSTPATATWPISSASRRRRRVPVIASLNATTPAAWTRYARMIEDAGADALELNLYHLAADPTRTAADMEADRPRRDRRGAAPRSAIPLAVKLSPYYSAMANFAAERRRGRRRRARAVQPLLPTRPRPRHARGRAPRRAEQPVGAAPAAALDRHPVARSSAVPRRWPPPRASPRAPTW